MRKLLGVLLVVAMLAFLYAGSAETVRGDLKERFAGRLSLDWQGESYSMRSRLTTVLLAGVDQRGETEADPGEEFRNGGQADFQLLLVIDDNRDCVYGIQINRDTMTEITILNVLGQRAGTRTAQICLAHSFGDGREQSCELLAEAVSAYLQGVPVDHYVVMDLDGIAVLNDAIGGVTVTLKDDFTAYDPEMASGSTLTLHGKQAEIFVRSRYYVGDQTNISRLERQKQYISAARDALSGYASSYSALESLVDALMPYIVTDMSRGRLINLADSIRSYEVLPLLEISGEAVIGYKNVMEFYPDRDSLMEALLAACFEPVG